MPESADFTWKFHRIGGLDQVTLRTPEELTHLEELDPKLWVALSCPANELQFDDRTLQLIDTNNDGRIRISEVREAVRWAVERLKDPASLADGRPDLPLSEIRQDTDDNRRLYAAAQRILKEQGREAAEALTQENVAKAMEAAKKSVFNGDGVMTPDPGFDPDLNRFIEDVVTVTGGAPDAGGAQGATLELAQTFMQEVHDYKAWTDELKNYAATFALGAGTQDGFDLLRALEAKLDDYFLRCQLAAFDARAVFALNAPETVFAELADRNLDPGDEALKELPLAHVQADQPLPLESGLNPAWREQVHRFRDTVIVPLLGPRGSLSFEDWGELRRRFTSYAALVAKEPANKAGQLGAERLDALLSGDILACFEALVRQDADAAQYVKDTEDAERLVLYHQHLHRLLMNFVSFCDFYALSLPTTFQIGKLFIDGRSCHLCLRVEDIAAHAAQAQLSHLCLAYCECTRDGSTQKMNIVAAITAGDARLLIPGRHGIFVDTDGVSWEAVLVKLVDNPISIRTAMFAPYRRIGRMVTDQIEKFTDAKSTAIVSDASKSLEKLATEGKARPFDIGRSMGIFAAIGLALGAIGTALASIASALFSLSWWQFPLLLAGLFLAISGPSMFLAWLKLRRRTLGPVLDASGWAVNSQIPINFMLGSYLTDTAALPPNANRSFNDPFRNRSHWKGWLLALAVACIAAGAITVGYQAWERSQSHSVNPAETVGLLPPITASPAAQTPAETKP